MKKNLIALLASALIISSVAAGDYEKKSYNSGYKTAVIDESLEFEAEREWYEVELSWDSYKNDDFKYYKIMKSTKTNNPIYPEQSAIWVLDNKNEDEFYLKNWDINSAYYRVCVIRTDNARTCSNVVKLEWFEKKETVKKEYRKEKEEKTEYKKVYTKEKLQSVKKTNLDSKLVARADKMVDNLVARLEKQHGDDTDKKGERLETIIKKLENLNAKIKSEQTKALVTYIIEDLREALNELSASDEIEKIFNILEED